MAMMTGMPFLWPLLLLSWPLLAAERTAAASTTAPAQLVPGQWVKCPTSVPVSVFCHNGHKPHLLKMFQSAYVEIRGPESTKWSVYLGNSAADVKKSFKEHQSVFSWLTSSQSQGPKEVQLTPFNSTCLGVAPAKSEGVEARLILLHVSYYRLGACIAGVFLLFLAPRLARSKICHYFSGVSFGVVASALVLSFIMWRLIPKKGFAMSVLVGGWMVGVYLLGMAYENARQLINEYSSHLAIYFLVTGLLSFFAVHRLGPVSNPRTLDCVQWSLQLVAGLLILLSSHFIEGAIGVLILALSVYNFPATWSSSINTFVRRRIFRPEHKFISVEEFEEQAATETAKALKELREFCSTPQSDPWKLQLSLKDPQRFARFVQGESHLNNEEVLSYDTVNWGDDMLTDDEDY